MLNILKTLLSTLKSQKKGKCKQKTRIELELELIGRSGHILDNSITKNLQQMKASGLKDQY